MNTTPLPFGTRPTADDDRSTLHGDCLRCHALCCTALGFERSADFAVDKPAGTPCPQLATDHRCTIHDALRARGYRGCTVYDCFGAGQIVSAATADRHPGWARTAFPRVQHLREMLWHLHDAAHRTYDPDTAADARALTAEIHTAVTAVTAVTTGTTPDRTEPDIPDLHARVRALLRGVSDEIRGSYPPIDEDRPRLAAGVDLAGADLRHRRVYAADLRGACLIGADLRGCDLTDADLLGADLRDARIDDADLSRALYVTSPQIGAARGNRCTRLPADIPPPSHFR